MNFKTKFKIAISGIFSSGVFLKISVILLVMSMMTIAVGLVANSKITQMNQVASMIFNSNTSVLFPLSDFLETIYRTEFSAGAAIEMKDSEAISALSSNLTNCSGQIGNFLYNLPEVTATELEGQWRKYETAVRDLYNALRHNENHVWPLYNLFLKESNSLYEYAYELSKAHRIVGLNSFNKGKTIYSSARSLQTMITYIGVILGLLIGVFVALSIIYPLHKLKNTTRLLAQGDLNAKVDFTSNDEVGAVASTFNQAVDELRSMVTHAANYAKTINTSTDELFKVVENTGSSLGELTKLVDHLAAGASSQSESVDSVINTIQRATSAANMVTKSTLEINKVCQEASNAARRGEEATEEMVRTIDNFVSSVHQIDDVVHGLVDDSKQIQVLVDVIRDIAEKTTLLSLNASIEAARAGEHGHGFAVVATNIRQLATRARESVEHINKVIGLILKKDEQVVTTVAQSNKEIEKGRNNLTKTIELFKKLVNKVEIITHNISQIAETASQMGNDNRTVISEIELVSQISQNNIAATEEVSATFQQQYASTMIVKEAARQLQALAKNLAGAANRFNL